MKAERWELDLELERMVEAARHHKPVPLRTLEARRVVRGAVEGASTLRERRKRTLWWGCAAAAAVALFVIAHGALDLRSTTIAVGPRDRALRLSLKAGDTLVAAPDTELAIVAQEPEARHVRVERGAALFDVVPLASGQRFEVETVHARMHVVGTVFTVEVDGERTLVRVYEGRVLVAGTVVDAGSVWSSQGPPPPKVWPLDSEARAAAEARRGPSPALSAPAVVPLPGVSVSATGTVTPTSTQSTSANAAATGAIAASAPSDPLAEARRWLELGESERVLAAVRAQGQEPPGPWLALEADALRALGQFAAALERYEQAARALGEGAGRDAAFAGAALSVYQLHSPERALALLDDYQLDDDTAPLRERASVVRIDALLVLGDRAGAQREARRYLAREPETKTSLRMRALLEPPAR